MHLRALLLPVTALLLAGPALAQPSYLLFESGPVRPLALSPDGTRLFVVNTPDNHLEIFDIDAQGLLQPAGSVKVGMEPVAVAARSDAEIWVVNHLSDSVSVLDVSGPPRVVRTLLVGDEPRDIVFAGSGGDRAFITTAHRGQHREHASLAGVPGAGDPELTTPGIGRADVWVFDASDLGAALGGVPIQILSFFADTPRALATDGTTVYVGAFHSGNQSTVIPETVVCNGFDTSPCGVPGPSANAAGDPAPETGLIVRFDGSAWRDAIGRDWSPVVKLSLPDHDVFALDANTLAPASVPEFDHVGTILFNMAINPVTGKLYVSNTESPNHVRFEGPGIHGGSTVQGHLSESRITVIDPVADSVDPQHLNQHIDYTKLHTDVPDLVDVTQKHHSLATPLQVVVSDDPEDQRVYVAAFGSGKIGVFNASQLEDPAFEANFDPALASAGYLTVGGGPAGLALSRDNRRLYVLTRFDNQVAVASVGQGSDFVIQRVKLHNPEPSSVTEGRPFLYDAGLTSGNGEASCSSCHIFGDFDSLAWNLGDPDALVTANPQQVLGLPIQGGPSFHPMKGPMTTQTLRGMATHGGLHWRGDRTNGLLGLDACDDGLGSICDEDLSFRNFIVAFEGLLGRDGILDTVDMQKFSDFTLQLMLPPNPVAAIDGMLTESQANGQDAYFNAPADAGLTCNFCHVVDASQGFFGTGGDQTVEGEPQLFKVAHLRNAYQKVGMFGIAGFGPSAGDQVRGTGYLHDGAIDTLFRFLDVGPFVLSQQQIIDLEQFTLAFPTDLAPVVGQQVTLSPANFDDALVNGRVTLLDARAGTAWSSAVLGGTVTECELVVSTVDAGLARSWVRQAADSYRPDDGGPAIALSSLRGLSDPTGSALDLTFTCAPPGSGTRMGIDRDLDSVLDAIDNCPAAPNGSAQGTCTAGAPELLAARCTASVDCGDAGFCSLAQDDANADGQGDACEISLLPEPHPSALLAYGAMLLLTAARLRRAHRETARPLPNHGRKRCPAGTNPT